MSAYLLASLAEADIFEVWTYIAKNSETAAERVEEAIYDACAFLAGRPLLGHTRRDLTSRSLRFCTLSRYPNYTVVYRPETAPLQIIAVLHGKTRYQAHPQTAPATSRSAAFR